VAIGVILMPVAPAWAAPAPAAQRCAAAMEAVPDAYAMNTIVDDEALRQDPATLARSVKALNTWGEMYVHCADGPAKEFVGAYLAAWKAEVLFIRGEDWKTTLNLSDQLLGRCVVRYHGTMRGAACETQLQKNARHLVTWED
jgi:hypothetical protein